MSQIENVSFRKLLSECESIRIPEIQRDYAQGRNNEQTRKILKDFIESFLPVLNGSQENVSLDFLYGYQRNGAFEPLDGQQRLTMLFLLHWLFSPRDCHDLRDDKTSRFRYATRKSSKKFCDALVGQSASELLKRWEKEKKLEKKDTDNYTFSSFLQGIDWFEWTWRYDPTIASMLNALNAIIKTLEENGIAFDSVKYENLDHIVFHRLDLDGNVFTRIGIGDKEFKLGEELYVKMNARGKELSDFDKLKSTLEEEIQLQKEEQLADDETETKWRTQVDGCWADYFWQTKNTKDPKVIVRAVEDRYRRFLNRVIAFQLGEKLEEEQVPQDDRLRNYWTKLKETCLSTNDAQIEKIVDQYVTTLRYVRHLEQKTTMGNRQFVRLDFGRIISDLDSILLKKDEKVLDITSISCPELSWEPNDSSQSMLREFVEQSLTHDRRLEYSAIVAFSRLINISILSKNEKIQKDFAYWMRFVRNCSLPRNLNQQIDTPDKERRVRRFLFANASVFAARIDKDSSFTMREYIAELGGDTDGLESASLIEEQIKAKLKADENWKDALDSTENNAYLWGQLRAPLNWAKRVDEEVYDLEEFKKYAKKLALIFPVKDNATKDNFWKALLCLQDYRMSFSNKRTLITFDNDRDISWKRYMRNQDQKHIYAPILKELIDIWMSVYSDLDLDSFLMKMISDKSPYVTDWRKYVLGIEGLSTSYCQQWGYLVDYNGTDISGHKWLVPKSQIGESRRSYELFTTYLRHCKRPQGVLIYYGDSISPDQKNSITFSQSKKNETGAQEITVFVQARPDGMYLYRSGQDSKQLSDVEVIVKLKEARLID